MHTEIREYLESGWSDFLAFSYDCTFNMANHDKGRRKWGGISQGN